MNTDISLLKSGNIHVFNKLYFQYGRKIYALCLRFLKNQQLSEEVVQEVFINLWVNREKLTPDGNIYLYLYVIAKRLCLNELRKFQQSEILFTELTYRISELDNRTEEGILASEMEQLFSAFTEALPAQQKLVFKMSREEGLSHREIAEQLGISQNTVKNHIIEALKTLKKKLNQARLHFLLPFLF